MIRHFVRWVFNLDLLKQLEEMQAEMFQMEVHRDAYRENAQSLAEEDSQLRKTIALQRSLIGILRDVNRELDERNASLEKRPPEGVA
jgi:non-homologous end joining protein Ku